MIPSCISEKDFKYQEIPASAVLSLRDEFYDLLDDFALTIKIGTNCQLQVNENILGHIFKRVDQRKDYYMYYHSTPSKVMHISHEKEMGLWAYWISKYKPISFVDDNDTSIFFMQNGCTISDAFAAYIIISIVCSNNKARAQYFTPKRVLDLFYDLSNRDFSKEAMISRIEDLIA